MYPVWLDARAALATAGIIKERTTILTWTFLLSVLIDAMHLEIYQRHGGCGNSASLVRPLSHRQTHYGSSLHNPRQTDSWWTDSRMVAQSCMSRLALGMSCERGYTIKT